MKRVSYLLAFFPAVTLLYSCDDKAVPASVAQQLATADTLIAEQKTEPLHLQVPFDNYRISPAVASVVKVAGCKTEIHVPPNAFVDINGNTVTDSVDISFRQFTNPAEIAFSKIPMTIEQEGETMNFNSAGMFEIRGNAKGNPVMIAPGKNLKVDFELAAKPDEIGFFKMNDQTKKWERISEIKKSEEKPLKKETSENEEEPVIVWTANNVTAAEVIPIEDKSLKAVLVEKAKNDKEMKIKIKNASGTIKDSIASDGFKDQFFFGSGGLSVKASQDRQEFETTEESPVDIPVAVTTPKRAAVNRLIYPDVVSGLPIENFAVYNCDQVYRLNNAMTVAARFISEEGHPINQMAVLSVIDLNYNAAFSFYNNRFSYDALADNVLVLTTFSNDVYICGTGAFRKASLPGKTQGTYQMKNVSSMVKNAEDLSKLIKQEKVATAAKNSKPSGPKGKKM